MKEYIVEMVVKIDDDFEDADDFITCLRSIEHLSRGSYQIRIAKVKEITNKEVGKCQQDVK